ncbi:hypothetical protein PR048_002193 [Dryococelus australis]|uniref:Uncharacterized protein n=1 Tax=Dryococelus australis TaxID=614101 RepID=A0ABQ9IJK9_9NEOP|nr:hypothetical protein PR048_002193 [Dryococelus australis]
MPPPATASSPAEAFLPPERVITPVLWSEYSPGLIASIGHLEHLDNMDEEVEVVTLRDLHAKVRLFREDMAAATHNNRILCDRNYAVLLEEV